MAKKNTKTEIRLVSTEGTGYFYVTKKNPKKTEKLKVRKYDRKARKHVEFTEKPIK